MKHLVATQPNRSGRATQREVLKAEKTILVSCRNGHWFKGRACPIDGYYDDVVDKVLAAENRLQERRVCFSLMDLVHEAGLEEDVGLARVLIVETGAKLSSDVVYTL